MSAAPGRPKQADAPSGGSARSAGGGAMSAAPGRPKQADAPSGARRAAPVGAP
jgi:multidrug efflux pump